MSEGNFHSVLLWPDMVLYSEFECIVYFIELRILFEDVIEEAFERKRL